MAPDLLFLHVLHRMTAPARPAPPCGTDDGELSSPPKPPRRPEHIIPAKAGIQDTHHPLSNTPLSLRGGAAPTWQSQPPAHPVPPRRPFTLSPPSYPRSLHVQDRQTPPPRRPKHVIPAKAVIQNTHHPLSNTPLSLRGGASPTWQSQPPAHPVPPRRPFTLSPPSYPQSLHVPDLQTALPPHAVIPAGPLPLKSCQDNLLLKSGPITLTSGPSFSVYIRANPWFLLSSPDS